MGNASSNNEIKLGEKIGEGSYGEVYKAVWRGRQVAAKRIFDVFFEGDDDGGVRAAFLEKFKSEWEILSSLQHESIVKYYTVILPPAPETPIIVTELLECDLSTFLRRSKRKPKISFADTIKIMLDVAEGLNYLHLQKPAIVHRDIASKNILLTKTMHGKIADLGLAKAFPHGAMFATAVPGTLVYAAPETYPRRSGRARFAEQAVYTEKIDIFSFGAMMLETIIGHLPHRLLPDPILEGKLPISYFSENLPLRLVQGVEKKCVYFLAVSEPRRSREILAQENIKAYFKTDTLPCTNDMFHLSRHTVSSRKDRNGSRIKNKSNIFSTVGKQISHIKFSVFM